MIRRLHLTHPDGTTYLRRWGLELPRGLAGIYLHRIDSPDPGNDLHDHPWPFVSIVLRGSYTEVVADARTLWHRHVPSNSWVRHHVAPTVRALGLTRAHRIVGAEPGTWTLVLRGRRSREWGFYTPRGWVPWWRHDTADRPLREDRP
ncbi:MAG: hypothetical protein U5R31_03150 [Acidimicrobiia bacterium]|nr:hypothetical protein [Acidimicrobiia bacterium]